MTDLRSHHIDVRCDAAWQRQFRSAQSIWREEQTLAMGNLPKRGPLGSMLVETEAFRSGANFLTDTTREVVRRVLENKSGAFIDDQRLYTNLLASQALAFNLFAEFVDRPEALSSVLDELTGGLMAVVAEIRFEYSPGRGDPKYTGDHSAYDVYIRGTNRDGGATFLGIEVKHHEDLQEDPARIRARHCELASELFGRDVSAEDELFRRPQEQITRDRLLVYSHLKTDGFEDAQFVLLVTKKNEACKAVAKGWPQDRGFHYITLERLVKCMKQQIKESWVDDLAHRYIGVGLWLDREEQLQDTTLWANSTHDQLDELMQQHLVHFRPSGSGVTVISLHPDTPQKGTGPYEDLGALAMDCKELLTRLEEPGRETPEKSLQSWMIRTALRDERRMRFLERDGEEIYFTTDEVRFPSFPKDVVGDILAVVCRDGMWSPLSIELKSVRRTTRLIEQVENMSELIDAHTEAFAQFASAVLDRTVSFEGSCEKMVVWPMAGEIVAPQSGKFARRHIRCLGYKVHHDGGFSIQQAERADRGYLAAE